MDERGGYFIHTLFPVPAARVAGRNTLSMRGVACLHIAVVCEYFGVNAAEINRSAQGFEVQEQLASVPLATAALSVQPIDRVGAKQKASQTLRSGGTPVRPWSVDDPHRTAHPRS